MESVILYQVGGEKAVRGLQLFDWEQAHLEVAFEWLRERREKASAEVLVALVGAVPYVSDLRFRPRKRIRWLEAQRDAARVVGDRGSEHTALGNLGRAYEDLGDARKAIECHEQALVIAREIGDRRGEGNALFNSALAFAETGEPGEAIARAEAALRIFEAIGSPYAATVRAKLAEWRGEQPDTTGQVL